MTRLRRKVKNPVEFCLDKSSDKALSAKHVYQEEHKRPDSLSALLFQESGQKPEARVHPGSKRTLGSYHETHKGTRPRPIW